MSEPIRFYHQGQVREVHGAAPTRTLLQHLREDSHCTGTKEGCAEGDCGACTVLVGQLNEGGLELKAINSCIALLPTLDGKAVFTVEDVALADGSLHPVQQALVECHASQCGFCTPGFVMSLYALYVNREGAPVERAAAVEALTGNLCRCTGYRPILDAAVRMGELPPVPFERAALAEQLAAIARSASLDYEGAGRHFHAPRTIAELAALRADKPDALLLAGGTDIGLWVTKQLRTLPDIIYVGRIADLQRVTEHDGMLEIGAAVTLEDGYRALAQRYPEELTQFWQRFASLPVRNAGTLGGNIANGSPIGDSMPWLIALGAQVVLGGQHGERVLALEDFYLGYGKKDLGSGEFVQALRIPLPRAGLRLRTCFRTYKVAKRFDQDISAVCAAFAIMLDGDLVAEARIAFGGMAATPKRALMAEAALRGQPWSEATLRTAMLVLARDYAPLSDMRASSSYRLQVAQNLLERFWLETRVEAPLHGASVNVFASVPEAP